MPGKGKNRRKKEAASVSENFLWIFSGNLSSPAKNT